MIREAGGGNHRHPPVAGVVRKALHEEGRMAWTRAEVDRVLADIIQRARQDPAFRRLCLEKPAAAVKEVASEELPPDFKLRFVDNDHADMVVVLPDATPAEAGQLSDEELSAVSGGIVNPDQQLRAIKPAVNYTAPLLPGACFAAGTPVVLADGSSRSIEAIAVGTRVLAFDDRTGTVVATTVSHRLEHAPEPVYRAVVDDVARGLLVTPNHPFYSGGRWRAIGDLAVQSELFRFDARTHGASPRRLLAFEPTGHSAPVYNLEVEDVHNYFADGVLVHNGKVLGK
jgi:hypothetical protein